MSRLVFSAHDDKQKNLNPHICNKFPSDMAVLGACCTACFPTHLWNRSDGTDVRLRRLRLQSRQCRLVLAMVQQLRRW